MKQVLQYYKNGALRLKEVPVSQVRAGEVLVRTRYSFISVGTERMKVEQARMSLLAKARERPDQVRQVLDTLREQGPAATLSKVRERLAAPTTLGYSCAGVVAETGPGVDEFRTGDRVACIGEGLATHAEFNALPRNLVAHVPASVSLEAASATGVGAIALQAVRQASLELGESVAIIGLGMLGQFLVQLCRANGCRVVGIDLDPGKRALAVANGAEAACDSVRDEALALAASVTAGRGVDAVFLTTAVKSNDPVELAAALVRDRGRVVCLGNTHIELDWREWFRKEIDFRFSRAMGAGIYDPDYELRGRDYPVGHVRWTARRNMDAFLELVAQGALEPARLVTHRFPFADAEAVFDRVASGELASAVGIVFEYPDADGTAAPPLEAHRRHYRRTASAAPVRLGLIGAGNYTKSVLLPQLARLSGASLEAVCTTRGATADVVAARYGCRLATTRVEDLFEDPGVNAILVATRHDTHARYAASALAAGKHAYVEKPLALVEEEIAAVAATLSDRASDGPTLWVGHNRRFSSLSERARAHLTGVGPRQIACRVHAAPVPADSWYQDPVQGGGLLFGDACHFIDLALFFAESPPVEVEAMAAEDASHRADSWAVLIRFANGGLATIHYVCGSNSGYERETVDVLGGGRSAHIAGFRRVTLRGGGRTRTIRRLQPDQGQRRMLETAVRQFAGGPDAPDLTDSFLLSAQTLLAAARAIRERRAVGIAQEFPFALT